jgi:N-hydroxyarylamine O-acetyltransferase
MSSEPGTQIDLDAYFERVAYRGQPRVDSATLKALHTAHATHVPFENVDVLRGERIRLDLPSLEAKIVRGGRGGYCFEQNTLFAAALEQIGFKVSRLQARVRFGVTQLLPRTHMTLEVEADGRPWLADVGYGGWGLLEPVPLVDGDSSQFSWRYQIRQEDGAWVLAAWQNGGWQDLYVFTREACLSVDYEPPNFYVSSHPESIFRKVIIAQRPTPEARYILRNREFMVVRGDDTTTRTIGVEQVLGVLAEHFGLRVAAGDWLRLGETD